MAHRTRPRDTTPQEDTEAPAAGLATTAHAHRFSRLPERIRPEDMVETRPATLPDPARDRYHADEWLVRYCG